MTAAARSNSPTGHQTPFHLLYGFLCCDAVRGGITHVRDGQVIGAADIEPAVADRDEIDTFLVELEDSGHARAAHTPIFLRALEISALPVLYSLQQRIRQCHILGGSIVVGYPKRRAVGPRTLVSGSGEHIEFPGRRPAVKQAEVPLPCHLVVQRRVVCRLYPDLDDGESCPHVHLVPGPGRAGILERQVQTGKEVHACPTGLRVRYGDLARAVRYRGPVFGRGAGERWAQRAGAHRQRCPSVHSVSPQVLLTVVLGDRFFARRRHVGA